jgi:hypothetical protein
MADLPRHPEAHDDEVDTGPRTKKTPWAVYVVGFVLAALFIVMVVLHLTGVVGPGAHG